MKIIEISKLENGSHRNQEYPEFSPIPKGWAVIPDSIALPSTFPFVHIVVGNVGGVPTVLEMERGVVPDDEPQTQTERTVNGA